MRMIGVLAVALLTAGAAMLVGGEQAYAQAAEPTRVTIRITDDGYDDLPEGFKLRFSKGEVVELTFVWDQQIYLEDRHIFVIEGYGIESEEINYFNRETTVRFVADQPGAFRLKCDLDCEIHDVLKAGTIEVGPASGGAGAGALAAAPPTEMTLSAPAAALAGDTVDVQAAVVDESGTPVVGGIVTLYELAGFMQTQEQEVAVASAVTDESGVARLRYVARRDGDVTLNAYLDGTIDHASSSSSTQVAVRPASAPLYQVKIPAGIPGVNRFLVIAILAGVWGTMLVVAGHVVMIAREGATGDDGS